MFDGKKGQLETDGRYKLPTDFIPELSNVLQEIINDYVIEYKIEAPPKECGFSLQEEKDVEIGKIKIAAGHNCVKNVKKALELTLYFRTEDIEEQTIEKEFRVETKNWFDVEVQETDLVSCKKLKNGT